MGEESVTSLVISLSSTEALEDVWLCVQAAFLPSPTALVT